jgi:putative DNA primase/helicase
MKRDHFGREFRPATEQEQEARRRALGRATAPDIAETVPTMPGAPAGDPGPRVELQCASDVRPEAVRWLWNGWLAAGKVHILAGPAGTGKTTLALALAATITTGGRWPDGTRATPADVVMWSGEDGIADTLVPRLAANGADCNRVRFVRSVGVAGGRRTFDPASDTPALALALARLPTAPALLIVDPIVSAVAGDSHKNTETRRALQPLVDLGERIGCAILGISHFSKGTSGRDPVERVTGSIAFGALARLVLAAVKTTDDDGAPGPRLFARA